MKKYCRECGAYTSHKPYQTGLYKYDGERVKKCKPCGHLRTESREQFPTAEMIHIPTQTKKKNMDDKK